MDCNPDKAEWTSWGEALQLFMQGATLCSCLPVALVVGLLLSAINQGDTIFSGTDPSMPWVKVGLNFVVPFCVSSYGFLNGCRADTPRVELGTELNRNR